MSINPAALNQRTLKSKSVTWTYAGPGPFLSPSLDASQFNAVAVRVVPPSGTGISGDIHVQGGPIAGGLVDLHDPSAVLVGLTSAKIIDVVVGTRFVAVLLTNLAGVLDSGQTWQITVTQYYAPSQSRVVASVG